MIDNAALAIVIPKPVHQQFSETYGQSREQAAEDAKDLQGSAKRDTKEIKENLGKSDPGCVEAYNKAAAEIEKITNEQYESWLDKILKTKC
jgi:hypothetical protein